MGDNKPIEIDKLRFKKDLKNQKIKGDRRSRSTMKLYSTLTIVTAILFMLLLTSSWSSGAESTGAVQEDLFEMSIEDLMNIEVTSVSKKSQKISEAAAAVFVITQEDLRRSGVTSIPEAMRMVPGLQVAKIDANKWAITSRGFNGFFANKLLVLIDGRSVYTPLNSGVFWDVQDYPLQDVDRIEVIRGPGATMWGANAVNGVINIITKNAQKTQGNLLEAGFGSEEKYFGTIRHGGAINDKMHYRAYAKYFNRDEAVYSNGDDAHDGWDVLRAGFRMDYERDDSNTLTVQGDIYDGDAGETVTVAEPPPFYTNTYNDDVKISGGNLLCRWDRILSNSSGMILQAYYDRTSRDDPMVEETRDTVDFDFQHHFNPYENHDIIWGLGYRLTRDDIENSFTVIFDPDSKTDNLISGFVQDDISIDKYKMHLTLGSKLEYNDYTGFEIQPNIRLLYKPDDRQSAWASVSRAVRTPSRGETDVRVNQQVLPPGTLPILPPGIDAYITFIGDDDFDSEELIAFELGYRMLATNSFSLDLATFYNIYDNLRTTEQGLPFPEILPLPPHLVIPFLADNKMDGNTYGAELAFDWRYSDWISLKAAYTFLKMHLSPDGGSSDLISENAENESPSHQVSLRPSINLPRNIELDFWMRYVDNVPGQGISSYISLDARISWRPRNNLEFTLVGQNLLDPQRLEFNQDSFLDVATTEYERGVYGKITWEF